jgi:spore coat polysaccharide biosynthesis protein SpsF
LVAAGKTAPMSSAGRTVAIVQARLGSTRLPRKVLLDLEGEPMLARVVHRVQRTRNVDAVIIATTTESRDDELAQLCKERGWTCSRGSEQDVLDRYYVAAREADADTIVRITSDCPLIDPGVVDAVISKLQETAADYASNVSPRTFPRGLDTEAFTFSTLEKLWREDRNPAWREHVTTLVHKAPEQFRAASVVSDEDCSGERWTVDTPEDLELVRRIYRHFGNDDFGWKDGLALMRQHPDWAALNRHIEQKKV